MIPQIPERVRTVQNWAGRQINRAQQFIRSASISQCEPDDLQPDMNQQVQASDGYFFEKFSQTAVDDKEIDNDTGQLTIVKLSINDNKERIQVFQDLYVEALYTIVHKVGKSIALPEAQLCKYVQNAFQVDDSLHQRLLDRAKKEKPPIVLLNVLLLEARDLIAKDINGFSDPFTMMGVVPGSRRKGNADREAGNGDHDDGDDHELETPPASPHSQKQGNVLHRFGGSFRRRIGSKKSGKSDTKSIPAKYIKASSVQYKTLNPKWNEKFQFIVDDVTSDRFHMDIWDHDDEEKSVIDAVTSLNHITGLKGLGRYFKEVTQSARAGSQDCTDDFLGCVTIKLKDVPSSGLEEWTVLEKRSDRSEVSGQVRLKLWLSTKEERIDQQEDDLMDVKQHIELIRQFALHEIRVSGAPVSFFNGQLSDPASTILHQHAIQGDLTELHQFMCQWLAYSAMINIGISFSFLYDILSRLISKWAPLALDRDEENTLAESFQTFDEHCKKAVMDHRVNVATSKRSQLESFSNMLRCWKLMRESPLYEKCLPFQKSFDHDINAILQKSADEYFQVILKKWEDEQNPCNELLNVLQALNKACGKIPKFDPIFKTFTATNYGQITYREFDRLLDEYICSEMMSEKKSDLKTMMMSASKSEGDNEELLITILKVHLAAQEFRQYRLPKQKYRLDKSDWSQIFDRVVVKWMDTAKLKAFGRVELACQLDATIQIASSEIRHTSSYVDVCHIIDQYLAIWERMHVSDAVLRADLTEKLVQCICKIAEYYADRVLAQLASDGFCGQLQAFIPAALLNLFCAAVNNIEQVRRSLVVTEKLHLDELVEQYEQKTQQKANWKCEVEVELDRCDKYLKTRVPPRLESFSLPRGGRLETADGYGETPIPYNSTQNSRLSTLLHRNFVRVMHSQVNILLPLFDECIEENPGLEPVFYQRLYEAWSVLTDFFHAGGKGISLETFETIPAHVELVSKLSLNQMSTIRIIEQYYKNLLKEQNDVSECKYGILNVRAYYNSNSQTLVIDVIGAKQVIPLDANGLSDPFVVIELVPRIRYPTQPVSKTKVVSKSLNPIFDETFEFHIPPKIPTGGMVHFVVMDHDFLRSNDFAGEAFLDLTEVPGFGTAGVANTLRQFNLILIHPSNSNKSMIEVLSSRKEDKEAQNFIRTLSVAY
ncbi:hypothetical protein L596_003449 [Steinernema carpocapsae]|uniref:C2 domain-containing protein n=1 Tax=Steinernema carpocapsae TaxID=34508 RepID=A0A4U8UU69_STECR|nr:hypothetical protein L596_003449 [Steinernema carpocapsae]